MAALPEPGRAVRRLAVVAYFAALVLPTAAWTQEEGRSQPRGPLAGATSQPGPDDISQWVKRLGDPNFALRAEASRRLCMIGSPARAALEEATRSSDAEVALRAKSLLEVVDQLLLAGCRVEVTVSKPRIGWNESADLRVTVQNRSEAASLTPFAASGDQAAPLSPRAQQVVRVLDLSDFLEVFGPNDERVDLHVDALTADADVEAVVRERAEAGPSSRLAAGARLEMVAPEFNRGWARYALLRQGTYRIRFAYVPEWDDEEFAKAGVGAVFSEPVELVVDRGAPANVTGPQAAARLVLSREREALSARLENPTDMPIWVNTNLAIGGAPFAAFRWVVWLKDDWRDAAFPQAGDQSKAFSSDRLIEIGPGAGVELGRVEPNVLRKTSGLAADQPLFVRAIYTNFCDPAWQRQQKGELPEGLRQALPARMLATTLVAEPLRID